MMHRLLSRQLRRHLGIHDDHELKQVLTELACGASATPAAARLIAGLTDFLTHVNLAYEQGDRDLDLARRSLEISSRELTQVNDKLREEATLRERILDVLRSTANNLLAPLDRHIDDSEGLQTLPRHLDALTSDLLATRRELEHTLKDLGNRQFAVDQHAIVSMTDAQGRITYANSLFSQISGYSAAELIGQDHRIIRSGVHDAAFFEAMWRTIASGNIWHGQICNRTRSGDLYWVAATIVPILDASGLPCQYIAIRTDITAQKQLKERLRQEQRFLQSVMDTVGEGLYAIDDQGRCTFANREAERLLGWRREEMDGRNMHDLIHYQNCCHEPVPQAECGIFRSIRNGHPHQSENDYFTRKDGSIFPVALVASPLLEDGKVVGSVVAFSDITERKRVEAEMRHARDAAERANRSKSDFLATMSHEIRTPMNGIIGMTDLALDTELTREQREYLGLVKSSADSLLDIINDILDFSKIEAGCVELEHIPFYLADLVATALGPLGIRARQKDIELICAIDPRIPATLTGDPGRLRQILVNLVGNAIKFSSHGDIEIRVQCLQLDGPRVRLGFSVRDQGIGIPAEKLKTIFDPFTQADTSTTRRFGGTGLGLAICARLVRAMGGEIHVDSTPGQGSIFHFSLDCTTDPVQAVGHDASAAALAGLAVLVVDDNAANRQILVDQLTDWRLQVEAVGDGAAALDAVSSAQAVGNPFDLILLDARMPDIDGFEVAERMRAVCSNPPCVIMMITTGGSIGDAERCAMLGLDHYLTKPLRSDALLHVLLEIVEAPEIGGRPTPSPPAAPTSTPTSTPTAASTASPAPDPARPAAQAGRVASSASSATQPAPLHILLAEDNAINQHLALTLLKKSGHRVELAVDGKQALAMFKRHDFDLVLMDVQMPEMDGLEATRLIRIHERGTSGSRHTRIVAMTANAMSGDREACLAAGMDDYIAKPLKPGELNAKLRSADTSQAPAAVPAVADFDYVQALQGGDRLMIEVMGKSFCRHRPQQLAKLRDAAARGDRRALLDGASALKNVFGCLCAEPAQNRARELERLAAQENYAGVPACLAHLSEEIAKLEAALRVLIGLPT